MPLYHSLTLLPHNMVHAIPEALSCSKGRLPWGSLKVPKVQTKINIFLKFWCAGLPCKITAQYRQFLRRYCVHKAIWPRVSLKVQNAQINVNIEPIWDKDQHQTYLKFWCGEHPWNVITCYKHELSHSQGAAGSCPPAHPGNNNTPPTEG